LLLNLLRYSLLGNWLSNNLLYLLILLNGRLSLLLGVHCGLLLQEGLDLLLNRLSLSNLNNRLLLSLLDRLLLYNNLLSWGWLLSRSLLLNRLCLLYWLSLLKGLSGLSLCLLNGLRLYLLNWLKLLSLLYSLDCSLRCLEVHLLLLVNHSIICRWLLLLLSLLLNLLNFFLG